ncbi:UDP-glycosyltransferase [Flavobacterium enshiense]|uniref:UDP-glycosyltransferase n=1 Tax=Flavobacterium enshiense DK69 TaxID=1107311 RepID=A0A0A2MY08_9FLAO|nr:UDP-glycosyltransferase [Flavobacterium enshiense]KGO97199.1 UDP-glycosyltransferase [Flavobacterium enshiense DK69]
MKKNKIFILLPDGVGLRNFAYGNFHGLSRSYGFDIVYWNNTPFDLSALNFRDIKIENCQLHPLTDIYKNSRKHIELNQFENRFNDNIYNGYRFPFNTKTFKSKIKTFASKCLIKLNDSEKGIVIVSNKMKALEESTKYFEDCLSVLKREKPDMVFCTNQRPVTAIAPIQAAKRLNIPTATFIFSWDNLPKATMVVETDYYFVWSDLMRQELRKYYPFIKDSQIFVTGTPQFENHYNPDLLKTREEFFKENNLDLNKKYICYSGDDVTTSPNDSRYLEDVAFAVRELNEEGENIGILFRRCPVDFSNRFDDVLERFKDVVVPVNPKWEKIGVNWDAVLPTPDDLILQTNTIAYTEFVINLGSSMVFDYVARKKHCVYVNYDVENPIDKDWKVVQPYKYVHFRSMPSDKSVIWFNNVGEIKIKIKNLLAQKDVSLKDAENWFETINQHPPFEASKRIWESIKKIVE